MGEKVRIRHSLNIEALVKVNEKMNENQRRRLQQTPFKWLLELPAGITICSPFISELITRWDDNYAGVRVGTSTLAFTLLDVCVALGLPVVGTAVALEDYNVSDYHVTRMFDRRQISVENLVAKLGDLNTEDAVEDYCKVYILLACCVLYFPNTNRKKVVSNAPFSILDDLESLDQYNWGSAVHSFLVGALNDGFAKVRESANTSALHVNGCLPLLEIWASEHLSLHPSSTKRFPRILSWTNFKRRSRTIPEVFKNDQVVEELNFSEEDRANYVLLQAIAEDEVHDVRYTLRDVEDITRTQKLILSQNMALKENMTILEGEVKTAWDAKLKALHGATDDRMPQFDNTLSPVVTDQKKRKMRLQLYQFCTNRTTNKEILKREIVRITRWFIRVSDLQCMRARQWVNNWVIDFRGNLLMDMQRYTPPGVITRFHMSSSFGDYVVEYLNKIKAGTPPVWTLEDFFKKTGHDYKLDDMRASQLIFAPVLFNNHWTCHVVHRRSNIIYVLDSLFGQRDVGTDRLFLDNAVAGRLTELTSMVDSDFLNPKLEWVSLPKQRNCDDCGIYVMKYMEQWVPDVKCGEYTMPNWTECEVLNIRQDLVCDWVVHPSNQITDEVLEAANVKLEEVVEQ